MKNLSQEGFYLQNLELQDKGKDTGSELSDLRSKAAYGSGGIRKPDFIKTTQYRSLKL